MNRFRTCEICNARKVISEFKVSGRGHTRVCFSCESPSKRSLKSKRLRAFYADRQPAIKNECGQFETVYKHRNKIYITSEYLRKKKHWSLNTIGRYYKWCKMLNYELPVIL